MTELFLVEKIQFFFKVIGDRLESEWTKESDPDCIFFPDWFIYSFDKVYLRILDLIYTILATTRYWQKS